MKASVTKHFFSSSMSSLWYQVVLEYAALLTKMSLLGHYETICTNENVHWERSSRANPHEIVIIDND